MWESSPWIQNTLASGIPNGERLELLEKITSGIPGKTVKGGQSQRRY
ncbi:MAG: hypothetical protein ABSG33_06715 [Candidatus Bathyarchaeia archaeon]